MDQDIAELESKAQRLRQLKWERYQSLLAAGLIAWFSFFLGLLISPYVR